MRRFLILFVLILPAQAATWYVNAGGGTRYSVNVTTGQCDGTSAASYASTGGTGVNQHCAFNDARFLYADGTYVSSIAAGSPKWGWIGASGDSYLIDCAGMTGGSCRIGYSGPNSADYHLGIAGDAGKSGAPAPISGTSGAHTKIYGINYASCTSDLAKTRLNGGYGTNSVLNLQGVSYVDVACFEITDHSPCGREGLTNQCATSYPLSDYANNGVIWSNATTNTTLTDINIHGMAADGMKGPTGDGVNVTRVRVAGNSDSGWNMDLGDSTTGTGNLNISYFTCEWNGFDEEYPMVDALPYNYGSSQSSGGYGDCLGTTTISSSPAWHIAVDHSIFRYSTQDGADMLHVKGTGNTVTITNSHAYGNMGQQFKIGAPVATFRNNVAVGNCNALSYAIPGTPAGYSSSLNADMCRAGDSAIAIAVSDQGVTTIQNNTLVSANYVGFEIAPPTGTDTCTAACKLIYQNNVVVGFSTTLTKPPSGNGKNVSHIYLDAGVPSTIFANTGSLMNHNATYGSSVACPAVAWGETNAICSDPLLKDESWHSYDYGDLRPALGSPLLGAGVAVTGITTDTTGLTRPSPPAIGAFEYAPPPTTVGGAVFNGRVAALRWPQNHPSTHFDIRTARFHRSVGDSGGVPRPGSAETRLNRGDSISRAAWLGPEKEVGTVALEKWHSPARRFNDLARRVWHYGTGTPK